MSDVLLGAAMVERMLSLLAGEETLPFEDMYVGLNTALPTGLDESTYLETELDGGSYVRQEVSFVSGVVEDSIANVEAITWPDLPAAEINSIFVASDPGNGEPEVLFALLLDEAFVAGSGTGIILPGGSLIVSFLSEKIMR